MFEGTAKVMQNPIVAEIPMLSKIGPSSIPENATQRNDGMSQVIAVAISGIVFWPEYICTIKRTEKMVAPMAKPAALKAFTDCHRHTSYV